MKKRIVALLLCSVMLLTLSPNLISPAAADDDVADAVVTDTAGDKQNQTVADVTDTEQATDGSGDATGSESTAAPDSGPVIESAGESETLKECTCDPKPAEGEVHKEGCPLYEKSAADESAESGEADKAKVTDTPAEAAGDQTAERPVASEIIAPTVNFTNVAPFLAPVTGTSPQQTMLRTMAYSARANNETPDSGDNGMVINKTATANGDGSYTITLEAYATGKKVITEVTEDVPADIVLVLDQSGSMAEMMYTYDFQPYTGKSNGNYYDLRHNGGRNPNLYHKLEDGSYATVSVTVQDGGLLYTEIKDRSNGYYWYYKDNLYASVDGEYQKVTLTWERDTYIYKLPNGTTIANSRGWNATPTFEGIDDGVLYLASTDTNKNIYTYTYTDKNDATQTIGTSTGVNTQPTDFTLYERYQSGSKTRLQALKTAVTTFANAVAVKAAGTDGTLGTADDVNHRIAVVGFASSGDQYNSNKYENTEVFVGATQYTYGSSANAQYGNALQSMNTEAGQTNITESINALAAYGGTFTNLGIEMANGIFKANSIPDGQIRNRVVVVFTDGYPGTSSSSVNSTVANNAVSQGYIAKQTTANGGYGATVYTVGIFSGADGTPVVSLNGVSNPNKFMHLLSSNYENAQSYSDSSKHGTATYPAGGDSYYLSAADADSLNNIFQQISDQIETGGSGTTLSEETVIKDIIAPAFTLPEGATASDITLETWKYSGPENEWTKNPDAMGATAVIGGTDTSSAVTTDNQISVTGFDFAENYVGTVTENGSVSYCGNKLVIRFKVTPRPGFLGGNNVYTNVSAGIYENGSAQTPVMTFNQPQVNVLIKDVTVTAAAKDVYLLSDVTLDALKNGATVKVGGIELDLSKETNTDMPYGLKAWQTEYVNIEVKITDENGNLVSSDLTALTDDTTYTVTVTVTPKTYGADADGTPATEKDGSGKANINVYKPELTYKDSEVFYGEDVPTNFDTNNRTATNWKHDGTEADTTKMGTAPALTITYAPDSTKIADDKINSKDDIQVDATVKIGTTDVTGKTTFKHTNCDGKQCGVPENGKFWLHVKTCTLTIIKAGGNEDEPYVFTVKKDGVKYTEVTVVGNSSVTIYELPVGAYTIQEDTGWSWRFTPGYGSAVTLSKANASGTIACSNRLSKPYWLNGFSTVVENVYGVQH